MTTPALPAPTDGGAGSVGELMNLDGPSLLAWVGEPGAEAPAAPARESPAPAAPARNERGQFVREGAEVVEDTMAGEGDRAKPPAEGAPPAPAKPDTPAEAPPAAKPAEASKAAEPPLTKFKLADAQGELDPGSVKDVRVSFEVEGKEVTHPLEKVVNLAQQNLFNARQVTKLSGERIQAQQEAQQFRVRAEALTQQLTDLVQQYEAVLSDPTGNAFLTAQQKFAELNSPEKRLERAQQENNELVRQGQLRELAGEAKSWADQVLPPLLTQVQQEYPYATEPQLWAYIQSVIPSFIDPRLGFVPRARWPEMAEHLRATLPDVARGLHEPVAAKTREVEERNRALEQELDQARRTLQASQRRVGRALAPVAPSAPGSEGGKKAPTITKAADALSDAFVQGIVEETIARR